MGAPAGATYENKSGGILESLDNLLSKAEDQLADARKEEAAAQGNFNVKKQALTDEISFSTKDMDSAKKNSAAAAEKKSVAEGDLTATKKDLQEDTSTLDALHRDCMSKASDFETETTARGEELKALATAKKIIKEATGAAASFMQVSMETEQLAGLPAVKIVRKLALVQQSKSLARLAKRMQSAVQFSAEHGSSDPFAKVKGMIEDMISKLESEAEADASQTGILRQRVERGQREKG